MLIKNESLFEEKRQKKGSASWEKKQKTKEKSGETYQI